MKPILFDLSSYKYVNGHTYYNIDLAAYNSAASVYLSVYATHDVTIELILSGSGEIFTHSCGKQLKIQMSVIHCDGIRLSTKKACHLAYVCNLSPYGGYEVLDPTPVQIAPVSSEFFLTDLIRRELSKRLAHMGMEPEDVDDLLDEDDFSFEDEDDASELPEDTEFTEADAPELPLDPPEAPGANDLDPPEDPPETPPDPEASDPPETP